MTNETDACEMFEHLWYNVLTNYVDFNDSRNVEINILEIVLKTKLNRNMIHSQWPPKKEVFSYFRLDRTNPAGVCMMSAF